MFGTKINDERMEEIKTNMDKTLTFMENEYAKGDGFIAGGDKISFADLLALGELKQLSTNLIGLYICIFLTHILNTLSIF